MDESITKNEEECLELKNIKYKTLLLNGVTIPETKSSNDISNLDKFLENEKSNNISEPWCKLNRTLKTKKFIDFVEIYKNTHKLNDEEADILIAFLKDSLDRKKLMRVKDVIYDKTNGVIKDIPSLCYIKATKHFTLKNTEKRISTLKSLMPKKVSGTIKNKTSTIVDNNDSSSDNEN
jgi:hypothetical protein